MVGLTERQRKYFATLRANLERDSGKCLEQWAAIARACPESGHNKRLAWLKEHHGIGRNSASLILEAAFPPAPTADLWKDPAAKHLFELVKARVLKLQDVVLGERKTYTSFSREFQFASLRPIKSTLLLGLAVGPEADPRLLPAAKEAWSERLKSKMAIQAEADIDSRLDLLFKASWDSSG
jgi:hypothetical protein